MIRPDLDHLELSLPANYTPAEVALAKTLFFQYLAESAHRFYHGKIQIMPKVPLPGFNWFNVWYTPGVSRVSTSIRDCAEESYELTNRGNLVAIVSDSTRVLGDGDVTVPGGLGVMEGKSFLMKFLGGIDAVPICIDSRNLDGMPDADIIVDFVKRIRFSFGAVNLEDISQPNCYRVLDRLRAECDIPVWHDDAQGTASVLLAGLLNALKIVGKNLADVRIVYLGAGASNTACARLIHQCGADPGRAVMFDKDGALTRQRRDFESDPRYHQQWELCRITNPRSIIDLAKAISGADILIAFSRPGPHAINPAWIASMARSPIVFACANPVPEIYPAEAKQAGAFIVGTGRGDFSNQVNNSMGFPGILKGALLVRARAITDAMAIAAARSLARTAENRGLDPDRIVPAMDEPDVFAQEAAAVGCQAIQDSVAGRHLAYDEIFRIAKADIETAHRSYEALIHDGIIREMEASEIQAVLDRVIREINGRGQ